MQPMHLIFVLKFVVFLYLKNIVVFLRHVCLIFFVCGSHAFVVNRTKVNIKRAAKKGVLAIKAINTTDIKFRACTWTSSKIISSCVFLKDKSFYFVKIYSFQ